MRPTVLLLASSFLCAVSHAQTAPDFSQVVQAAAEHRHSLRSYAYDYAERVSLVSQNTSDIRLTEKIYEGSVIVDHDLDVFRHLKKSVSSETVSATTAVSPAPVDRKIELTMRNLTNDFQRNLALDTIGILPRGGIGSSDSQLPFDFRAFGFGFKADIDRKTPWFDCIGFYEQWGEPSASLANGDGTATYLWGDFSLTIDIARGYWPIRHTLYGLTKTEPRVRTAESSFDMKLTSVGDTWLPLAAQYTTSRSQRIIRFKWSSINDDYDESQFSISRIEELSELKVIE